MKVLIVEDSADIAEVIETCFLVKWPEAEVFKTANGIPVPAMVEQHAPDLVILDIGLPDTDGMKVLKAVREFSDVPVIMLTARGEEMSRVRGLETGADDYMVKPFSHIELLARVRAVLRRTHMPELRGDHHEVTVGQVSIDHGGHRVTVAGREVALTPIEWGLLGYFIRNRGQIAQHQVLAEKVWGTDYLDSTVIKTAIRRLRKS